MSLLINPFPCVSIDQSGNTQTFLAQMHNETHKFLRESGVIDKEIEMGLIIDSQDESLIQVDDIVNSIAGVDYTSNPLRVIGKIPECFRNGFYQLYRIVLENYRKEELI